VKIKSGSPGKTSVQVKSKGSALTLPGPFDASTFFDPSRSVVVQLGNSLGKCWTSVFPPASVTTNEVEKMKASAIAPWTCGDGIRELGEACDGSDDGDCPTGCDSSCACLP
jgi:hypothetical protein